MSRYDFADEERIRAATRVRDWARSGLLNAAQATTLEAELRTDLKRTNRSFRIVLFIFGTIVVWATFGFCLMTFGVSDELTAAWSALLVGGVAALVAETLIARYRLYRFGVEEAFASWSVVLMSGAIAVFVSRGSAGNERPILAGLLTAAIVSFAIYRRYGYLYAAFGATISVSMAAFFLDLSDVAERLLSAATFVSIFLVARSKRARHDDQFPGDDYGAIEAGAWLGLYVVVNLQLSSTGSLFIGFAYRAWPPVFYWLTYITVWLVPGIGLYLGVRGKHRTLIWVSLASACATLMTNKMYLGWARHSWDPILLGVVLAGASITVRRWLSQVEEGHRFGFTPERILTSEQQSVATLGTLAGAGQSLVNQEHSPPEPSPALEPGRGGRSGGAGGGSGF